MLLLLTLVACGYDRTEIAYTIDAGDAELAVIEHHRNAWHDTVDECATVEACRDALRAELTDRLDELGEAGGTAGSGWVDTRGDEIDVHYQFTLPYSAALLAQKDSWVRRVEVTRPSGRTKTAIAFVDMGNDADAVYEIETTGRHRLITMPAETGLPIRVWVFDKGRGSLSLAADVRGEDGQPVHTPPWAPGVPGLVEALRADPLRVP